jgi:hypothetical protein
MAEGQGKSIARLRPAPELGVDGLLAMSLGLDVWERGPDHVLAAATEAQLAELERRRLASVERLGSREQYEARMRDAASDP